MLNPKLSRRKKPKEVVDSKSSQKSLAELLEEKGVQLVSSNKGAYILVNKPNDLKTDIHPVHRSHRYQISE
jgi:hypothetical protein